MGYKYKTIDGQVNGGGCGKCFCVCSFSRVAKCCVFIINTIILIIGVTDIGLGIKGPPIKDDTDPYYEDEQQKAAWIVIGLGFWFFVVSAFGYMSLCCLKKNKCYIVLSALLLASLLTFPIVGAYRAVTEECDHDKSNPSNASFEVYYPGNDFAKNLDRVQYLYDCCGSRGVNDYINISFLTEDAFVPFTCCLYNPEYVETAEGAISKCQKEAHEYQNGNTSHSFRNLQTMGCHQRFREICGEFKIGLIIVSSVLAFLEIFGILLYIGLWRDARSKDRLILFEKVIEDI